MDQINLNEQEIVRRKKMEDLREKGIDPFGQKFIRTANTQSIKSKYQDMTKEELHDLNVTVQIAGRIMTKRSKGKVGFMHIQDRYGQIQIYLRYDNMIESDYELFKVADIGDIVGIKAK